MSADRTLRVARWCMIATAAAVVAAAASGVVVDVRQQHLNAEYGQYLMHSPCSRPGQATP